MMRAWVLRHQEWALLGLGVLLVLATRLPFLPSALEDLDSVNFDMGVHDFDPYEYRPHPPGYAVFIGLAKLTHPWFGSHAPGLAVLSAVMSALALIPLYRLARLLTTPAAAAFASLLVVCNPVFWINGVRPMSDLTGFAAIVAAQWLLVAAVLDAGTDEPLRRRLWYAGVLMAAMSVGVRLQAIVLVGPMLALGWLTVSGVRLATPLVFAAGVAVWLLPTFAESGGVDRFWEKQVQVIAEAWPAEPLVAAFSEARAWQSLADAFLLPWGHPTLGMVLVVCAGAGLLLLAWRSPRDAAMVLALYGPYAVYHVLLQEAAMVRYAIPLLPLTAIPAAVLIDRLARVAPHGRPVAVATFVAVSIVLTGPSLLAYAREPSPPALAVAHITGLATSDTPTVLAGNHVFQRYVRELPAPIRVLPMPSWLEWRELNRYWLDGGAAPVWFLRDPTRKSLAAIDPDAQTTVAAWKWPDQLRRLLSGSRPTHVELVRIDRPRWFVDTGYLASGEAGPFDRVGHEPHVIHVRGDLATLLLVSVRSRGQGPVGVSLQGELLGDWNISGTSSLPLHIAPGAEHGEYVPLRLDAEHGLELLDVTVASPKSDLLAPVKGLFEVEPDEFGEPYRWMARDSSLAVVRTGGPARLTLGGRVPIQYYEGAPPRELRVSIDDGPPMVRAIEADDRHRFIFTFDLPDAAPGDLTQVDVHVSNSFSPDDQLGNGDTRPLSLMMYDVSVAATR